LREERIEAVAEDLFFTRLFIASKKKKIFFFLVKEKIMKLFLELLLTWCEM
jgi:hypothetical protein